MSDLLVKLYDLPAAADAAALQPDTRVRKPIGPEHRRVVDWVAAEFGPGWASEAQVALGNRPVSLFMALQGQVLLGFACYDATALGMFGPIGVAAAAQRQGLGAALLRACLDDMRSRGYAYAVVGSAGPTGFFARCAGAVEILDSSPGPYGGMLRTVLPPATDSALDPS